MNRGGRPGRAGVVRTRGPFVSRGTLSRWPHTDREAPSEEWSGIALSVGFVYTSFMEFKPWISRGFSSFNRWFWVPLIQVPDNMVTPCVLALVDVASVSHRGWPPGALVARSKPHVRPSPLLVRRHGTSSLNFTSSTTASELHTCTPQAKR